MLNSKMSLRNLILLFLCCWCKTEAFAPSFVSSSIQRYSHESGSSSSSSVVRSDKRTFLLAKKSGKKKKKSNDGTIAVNRSAYRNYEIIDTLDAGISLLGSEVKSVRDGKMNIRDGFVRPERNGRTCILYNVHIGKHTMTSEYFQHEERRARTLLIRKEESRKLLQQVERQGMTIVPLKAYFNDRNIVKIQIALCKGKNVRDKRQDIKNREAKKDAERMIKSFRVGN